MLGTQQSSLGYVLQQLESALLIDTLASLWIRRDHRCFLAVRISCLILLEDVRSLEHQLGMENGQR